jgi:HEAT repeat protein
MFLVVSCWTNSYSGLETSELMLILQSTDTKDRENAARALEERGADAEAEEAIPVLIDALFDSDKGVRVAARNALVSIGSAAVKPLWDAGNRSKQIKNSEDISKNIGSGLYMFDANAIPAFVEIYNIHHDETRSIEREHILDILIDMIERFGTDAIAGAPTLILSWGDLYSPYHLTIVQSLTRLGNSAVPDLIGGLSNTNSDVRYFSAITLGRIGPDALEAGPILVLTLDDRVPKVRLAARDALDKIGFPYQYSPSHAQRIDDLLDAMQDPNPAVRLATAEALGSMGTEAAPAINVLAICAQHDSDPTVREACEVAAKKIRAVPE